MRTTHLSIAPHQALTLPRLEHESLVIALSAGALFRRPNFGQPESLQLVPGSAFSSRGSTSDLMTNLGDLPIELLVVELKDSYAFNQITVPRSALDPLVTDPGHFRQQLENEHVRVLVLHLIPREGTEESQFGTRLEIPLTDVQTTEIYPGGRISERKNLAGTMTWQNYRMKSVVNSGQAPLDLLMVELKHPFCYAMPESVFPAGADQKTKTYMALVSEKVRKSWMKRMPHEAREGQKAYLAVGFRIMSDGSLSETGIELSTAFADEILVEKGFSAIREASPFPPFPPDLDKPELHSQIIFLYNLSTNFLPGCP